MEPGIRSYKGKYLSGIPNAHFTAYKNQPKRNRKCDCFFPNVISFCYVRYLGHLGHTLKYAQYQTLRHFPAMPQISLDRDGVK